MKPSSLPRLRPGAPVAIDTEGNNFHPDDGARVSAVSIAYFDQDITDCACGGGIPGCVVCGQTGPDGIRSHAFPYDQGVENKPWYQTRAQLTLFGGSDAVNLPRAEWVALWHWVTSQNLQIVMHNAAHDIPVIEAGTRLWDGTDLLPQLHWDTMLGAREFWPEQHTVGLAEIGPRILGKKAAKDSSKVKEWIRKNKRKYVPMGYPAGDGGYDIVPWEIIGPYADADARDTLALYREQKAMLDQGMVWPGLWVETMDACKLLIEIADKGLLYDARLSREQGRVARARQRELAKNIPFRLTDPAAKHYFFGTGKTDKGVECLGLKPYGVTPKGAPQLTAQILADMADEGIEFAPQFRDWNKLDTATSMWYDGYADKVGPDGRLRMKFRQTGTRSGRFSAERVNLQAIPQDFNIKADCLEGLVTPRGCIAAGIEKHPEWGVWEFDLAQAELRVASLMAGCTLMLDMIRRGEDLHGTTAKFLFKADEGDPRWDFYRAIAKRGNFSLIFDCGPKTFKEMLKAQTGIEISMREAQEIVYPWKDRYWQFPKQVQKEATRTSKRKWVELANGRRKWFGPRDDYHKAFNQKVQGSIGQLVVEWLLRADEICKKRRIQERADAAGIGGAGIILTVHDSLAVLMPRDTQEEVSREIIQAGIEIWDVLFDGVPGGIDNKEWKR